MIPPPSCSAKRRLIASPSPVPPYCRVIDESACVKGSKIVSSLSAGMPIPVSEISTTRFGGSAAGRLSRADPHVAGRRELDGVAGDVHQHLAKAGGIALDRAGHRPVESGLEAQPLLFGLGAEDRADLVDDLARRAGHRLDRQLAGVDFREVEDVVDQRQQVFAAAVDRIEPLHPLGLVGVGSPPQEVGKADHRVEGRADLMAHVGQERGAGAAGELGPQRRVLQLGGPLADLAFEFFRGLQQGLLGPLAVGDVEGDPLQKEGPPLLVADDAGLAVHPHLPTVAGDEAVLRAEVDPETARAGELRSPPLAVVGMQLAIPEEWIAQPFLLREPEHDFDLRAHVELVVPLVECGHEGDGRNAFDERPVTGLHPFAVGNVADGGRRQGTVVPLERTQADLDRKFLPVFAAAEEGQADSHRPRVGISKKPVAVANVPLAKPLRNQKLNLLADQFVAAVAEEFFGLQVDQQNRPVTVDHHQGVGGQLNQAAKDIFTLPIGCQGRSQLGGGRTLVDLLRLGPFAPARRRSRPVSARRHGPFASRWLRPLRPSPARGSGRGDRLPC